MSFTLPEPFQILVDQLEKLPGLGPKSAVRMAMTMLKWPETETRKLGERILTLRDDLCLCSRCAALSSSDPCSICSDPHRSKYILCLVPEWDGMLAIESGGFYDGQYLILGGLLSPLQKKDSQSLEIQKLLQRLAEGEIKELVLALGATLESENTETYIKSIISKHYPDVQISRLAQGLPLGSEVSHMDKETLRQSMKYRQKL